MQIAEYIVIDVVGSMRVDNANTVGRANIVCLRTESVFFNTHACRLVCIYSIVAVKAASDSKVVLEDSSVTCVKGVNAVGVVIEVRVAYKE